MLRWFRKYNKFILVIGCAVLMVAFLIPQAIQQFSPKPGDRVVGSIGDEGVTSSELAAASRGLEILQRLGLGGLANYEREQWFLMLRDAEAAGLGASDVEVSQALASRGIDPNTDAAAEAAERLGLRVDDLRSVMRDFLVAERYRMLASGHRFDSTGATLSSSPGLVALQMLNEAQNFLRSEQAQQFGPAFQRQLEQQFANSIGGTGRLSPPFVEAVLHDEAERVSGRLAVLEPEVDDAARAGVSEAQLQRLFAEYSSFLPGRGSPYPFGYRVPDRVSLEALSVPMQAVRDTVEVGTVDVLEAFRRDNPGATPTEAQRLEVESRLLERRADAKLRDAANLLRGELEAARRGIPTAPDGRLELGPGVAYNAPALEELAELVRASTGVEPRLTRRTDRLIPVEDAAALEGLATAGLPELRLPFASLLMELPAFGPEAPADPAAAGDELLPEVSLVPVQVGVAMPLLTDFRDGSLHLVRITAADAAHEPESLEAVREEVASDAARVSAYESLLGRRDALLAQAASDGIDALDARSIVDAPPFPRRTRRTLDGRPAAPTLPEAGRAPALVDAAFEAVAGLPADADVEALPAAERLVAAGIDGRMALGILRIDALERPTRADLRSAVASGVLTGLDRVLIAEEDEDPVSEAALRERLGFTDEG
ncbi:SurA N-terminal domain-containing protein [Phycisphaera mikurensis]|uniref:Uncharacterized protein n=1 Tax=Phycisphaera mikurensis (strain NBRC 102666 / KCTC 22515 / FYK2301M01) TaxID=1142394 RepID=I0IE86_PHYMF|nr:hypothetical protein [Phycisphaera mikurensis]MBB6441377.1 hypothetical protein [Phycisphaera mikurensis]BAM03574.1 hypothetical protein PSMK_14150 [Phycisphaera mikurensis NBRC 102666]